MQISSASDGEVIEIPGHAVVSDLLLTRPVTLKAAPVPVLEHAKKSPPARLVKVVVTGGVVIRSQGVRFEGITIVGDAGIEEGGCIIVEKGGGMVMSGCTVHCEEVKHDLHSNQIKILARDFSPRPWIGFRWCCVPDSIARF